MDALKRPRPVALIIMDGWGLAPASPGNAIELANTPNIDAWIAWRLRALMWACPTARSATLRSAT